MNNNSAEFRLVISNKKPRIRWFREKLKLTSKKKWVYFPSKQYSNYDKEIKESFS
jgi:hypothetical protein